METKNKPLTASEIRNLNLKKESTYSFAYWSTSDRKGEEQLILTTDGNEVTIYFDNWRDMKTTVNKMRKMGLCWGWVKPIPTDEEKGLAAADPKTVFNYSILVG